MSSSTSSSTSKKPSLSLFVSPSSPPLPSSSQLPSRPASLASTTTQSSRSRDLSPTATSRNHLSTSTYYPSYSNSNSQSNDTTMNDQDRRITSWGSAVSLSHSTNSLNFSTNLMNGVNGEEMTSLPSPLVGPSSGARGREWNGRGSTSSTISNLGESISVGDSTGGKGVGLNDYEEKGFRFNESSVFSELRESTSRPSSNLSQSYNNTYNSNNNDESQDYPHQSTSRSNGGSFSSTSSHHSNSHSHSNSLQPLSVQSRNHSITSEDLPASSLHRYPSTKSNVSRTPSGRSKTLSFFDSDFTSGSVGGSGGGISPPPNPLSRNSSLNTSIRGGGKQRERNWLDEDSRRPGIERRPSHESPENSPNLTPIAHFSEEKKYQLPKLPNLPPLLVPFSNSNWSNSNSTTNPLASSSDSGSIISPTYSSSSSSNNNYNYLNTSRTNSNSTNSPNLMSTLPTAISPPKNYKTRFDPPPQLPPQSTSPLISTSQISTPTLTSQNQPIFETLNSQWKYLDSPSIHSEVNLPPIQFEAMQIVPPTPTLASNILRDEKEELEEDREPEKGDKIGEWEVVKLLGKGSFSRVALARSRSKKNVDSKEDELVALKMILRKSYEGNERMRISVVREVEVLKHIHHPSLTTLLSAFSTPIYTVLVLDYSEGGELFDFLSEWHSRELEGGEGERGEEVIRRIFGEVCDAVDWMHGIGLVHRDIKLENILLTSRPFPNNLSSNTSILTILPTPFVKLTDFGLSRFIPLPTSTSTSSSSSSPSTTTTSPTPSNTNTNINKNTLLETHPTQLLTTRCGSESYAAPELIMGKKYDGRKTDSWALGVVLFTLGTGEMPFVEGEDIKVESSRLDESLGTGTGTGGGRSGGRKTFLMKIAKGEYSWPDEVLLEDLSRSTSTSISTSTSTSNSIPTSTSTSNSIPTSNSDSISSPKLAQIITPSEKKKSYKLLTPSFKSLVSKFLIRDPNKRLIIGKVWEEDWFIKNRETGEMRSGTPIRVKGWVGGRN